MGKNTNPLGFRFVPLIASVLLLFCTWTGAARASLILTSDAVVAGYSLSTFASGFPTGTDPDNGMQVGPLGVAYTNNGGVLVTDKPGNLRLFATDADNQLAPSATIIHNYSADKATGMTQFGSAIYMTRQTQGDVVQLNQDGSFNHVVVSGLTPYVTGITVNPTNGHLYVSTLGINAIYDIDPVAQTKTLFTNVVADGVAVSPDGKTLYAVEQRQDIKGKVIGYDTTTRAKVFDSGSIGDLVGEVDGIVVGVGKFAGNLFVNTHAGAVYQINLTTKAVTLIAQNGSRGDFMSLDPRDNSIIITQSDSLMRLTVPAVATAPLPAGVFAGGMTGLLVLVAGARRRSVR